MRELPDTAERLADFLLTDSLPSPNPRNTSKTSR
jgi:hypothetical protein